MSSPFVIFIRLNVSFDLTHKTSGEALQPPAPQTSTHEFTLVCLSVSWLVAETEASLFPSGLLPPALLRILLTLAILKDIFQSVFSVKFSVAFAQFH